MQRLRFLSLGALAVVLASCGGSGGEVGTSPNTPSNNNPNGGLSSSNTVTVGSSTFSPGVVTIQAGNSVTWKWDSCTDGGYGGYASCVSHNVTFDDGSNIASVVQDSGSFSRSFSTPGTYNYHCVIHGSAMSGQVVVK